MKKFLLLGFSLFCIKAFSQTITETESASLDDMLSNINQSSVTSGIIYERAAQFANLYNFNKVADYNTANSKIFVQALAEVYNASNKTKFISNEALKDLLKDTYQDNAVDLGILNTPFEALNFSEENPSQGGLTLNATTNKFQQISGKAPFLSLQTTVISPLKDYVIGKIINYNIRNDLYFKNTYKNIKTLTADFGDGAIRNLISNGTLTNQTIAVNYTSGGNKKLTFNITFDDNTTLTTYAQIYLKYVNNTTAKLPDDGQTVSDFLIDNGSIQSEEAFQGYDEPFAFKGKIDYRIFYHTNNGTGVENKKLLKPIIIIDGFDPGDKRKIQAADYVYYNPNVDRSIEDMMTYYDSNKDKQFLIQQLRTKGYDVVIINNPTYCVGNTAPYSLVNYNPTNNTCSNNGKLVNGGADFIERNALNLVALIKNFNSKLATNGSAENLVIVGPSMGGQISRYALAYMEKKGWQHNTRLWVNIDSPHLGANIPYGVQSLVYYLQDESPAAKEFYYNQLGSPAAKQQLIEDHLVFDGFRIPTGSALNGKTVSQGFPSTRGSSFFIHHYNAQFNNGLPNSKGYPQNLRKIALTNGSLTGSKKTVDYLGNEIQGYGNDNEFTINVRGFERLCFFWCWKVHVASMETYTMPSLNATNKVARFKKGFKDRSLYLPNMNTRGNMDTVPGGYFPAYDILANEIMGESVPWSDWWILGPYFGFGETVNLELRENRKIHSFIPTFSSLGIKNPDRNWAENLQRNLVCTNETPFDSYYGAAENTQHTSFTEQSVYWLMKELDGQPQLPSFPIEASQFIGSNIICLNEISEYYFPDPCKIPGNVTWSISNANAQILSSTGTSITIKGLINGAFTLTADFGNGQTLTKTIWIGKPRVYIYASEDNSFMAYLKSSDSNATLEEQGINPSEVTWRRLPRTYTSTGFSCYISNADPNQVVEVKIPNSCGTITLLETISFPPCESYTITSNTDNTYNLIPAPCPDNPVTNKGNNNPTIIITDIFGREVVNTTSTQFSLQSHLSGTYYARVIKNGQVVHTQTLIKH